MESKPQQWFAELKHRKVFRVAGAYLVVAWLVLQVADVSFGPMGLPEQTLTLVIALLVLGFPIACILAWAFDSTPAGIERTRNLPEEIINALCVIRGLRVASRTSSFQFKGRAADVREIGRRLSVRAVLEGSVRKAESANMGWNRRWKAVTLDRLSDRSTY